MIWINWDARSLKRLICIILTSNSRAEKLRKNTEDIGQMILPEYSFKIIKIRPSESFGGEAPSRGGQAIRGQKERGLGGRNFCPPVSVPIPFEQEKSGRGG